MHIPTTITTHSHTYNLKHEGTVQQRTTQKAKSKKQPYHVSWNKMRKGNVREKVSGSDVESAVLLWFAASNKPATVQSLVDALQSRFSKPNVQKALDALYEKGDIQAKDFKKVRLFFLRRAAIADSTSLALETSSEENNSAVDAGVIQQTLSDAMRLSDELAHNLTGLGSLPSLSSLQSRLSSLQEETHLVQTRLESLRSSGECCDVDPSAIASLGLSRVKEWRERKRMAETLLESIGESDLLCLEKDTIPISNCSSVLSKWG